MKKLALLLLLSTAAFAEKMHVKVISRNGHISKSTSFVPGVTLANGSANANCITVNCYAAGSASAISVPAHTQDFYAQQVNLQLLLPDGRRVDVTCNDAMPTAWRGRTHRCSFPLDNEAGAEANFSGDRVKLTWGVGIDGKKKESETYVVGTVYPASTANSKP